jgi:hypothetical protein
MSWHCRLPNMGRNRPKKKPSEEPAPKEGVRTMGDFHSDPIPF